LNPKIVPNGGLCRLCDFAARRPRARLADFVAPVQVVNPAESPADVIGVPASARLRIEAASLAVTNCRSPPLMRRRRRCVGHDRHETGAFPARSRYLHLMSGEIGVGSGPARQLRFGEVVAAVLSLTDPCG